MALASTAQALYLFIDGATQKCFYEELPKGTLVSGHYAAEEYDDRVGTWQQHEGIKIYITVDVRLTPFVSFPHYSSSPAMPGSTEKMAHFGTWNTNTSPNCIRKPSTATTASCPKPAPHQANSTSPPPKQANTRFAS